MSQKAPPKRIRDDTITLTLETRLHSRAVVAMAASGLTMARLLSDALTEFRAAHPDGGERPSPFQPSFTVRKASIVEFESPNIGRRSRKPQRKRNFGFLRSYRTVEGRSSEQADAIQFSRPRKGAGEEPRKRRRNREQPSVRICTTLAPEARGALKELLLTTGVSMAEVAERALRFKLWANEAPRRAGMDEFLYRPIIVTSPESLVEIL